MWWECVSECTFDVHIIYIVYSMGQQPTIASIINKQYKKINDKI